MEAWTKTGNSGDWNRLEFRENSLLHLGDNLICEKRKQAAALLGEQPESTAQGHWEYQVSISSPSISLLGWSMSHFILLDLFLHL